MATQRYISTSFWDDRWIRSLNPMDRYLYLYLMTNPLTNIAGVYSITMDRIAFDTGIDERALKPMFNKFEKDKKVFFFESEWIILPNWPKHQQWDKRSKIQNGIIAILKTLSPQLLGYLVMIDYKYPIDTLSIPYVYDSNYSDSDSDSDSIFKEEIPPNPPSGGTGDVSPDSKPSKPPKQYITDEDAIAIIESCTSSTKYAEMLALFVRHRREIKKPMTRLALEQTVKVLDDKLGSEKERIDCISLSIANGWQGVLPGRINAANGFTLQRDRRQQDPVSQQSNDRFAGMESGDTTKEMLG